MEITIMYMLILLGSLFIFTMMFSVVYSLVKHPRKKLFFSRSLWHVWKKTMVKTEDEGWDSLLRRAGQPFGWGKAEWLLMQWLCGIFPLLIILIWALFQNDQAFPFFTFILVPSISFLLPHLLLKLWAAQREEILSVDIARFINRYVNLLENHVPAHNAIVKAAKPTRQLKHYVPSLSEWNRDRLQALETFKHQLGVDDAIILVSNMRMVEQLSAEQITISMQRLEWAVDNRRMFRHRKKIRSLGIGYSIIVYPAFYIGLIVGMFPWYKLLTEILDKYLV